MPDRPLYALHSPGAQTTIRVKLFLDFVTEYFRKQNPVGEKIPSRLPLQAAGTA